MIDYLKRVIEYIGIMLVVFILLFLTCVGIALFAWLVASFGIWGFIAGLILSCFIFAAFG